MIDLESGQRGLVGSICLRLFERALRLFLLCTIGPVGGGDGLFHPALHLPFDRLPVSGFQPQLVGNGADNTFPDLPHHFLHIGLGRFREACRLAHPGRRRWRRQGLRSLPISRTLDAIHFIPEEVRRRPDHRVLGHLHVAIPVHLDATQHDLLRVLLRPMEIIRLRHPVKDVLVGPGVLEEIRHIVEKEVRHEAPAHHLLALQAARDGEHLPHVQRHHPPLLILADDGKKVQ